MNKFKKLEGKTYFTPCSSVSIVNFEQLNADWDETLITGKWNKVKPGLFGSWQGYSNKRRKQKIQ